MSTQRLRGYWGSQHLRVAWQVLSLQSHLPSAHYSPKWALFSKKLYYSSPKQAPDTFNNTSESAFSEAELSISVLQGPAMSFPKPSVSHKNCTSLSWQAKQGPVALVTARRAMQYVWLSMLGATPEEESQLGLLLAVLTSSDHLHVCKTDSCTPLLISLQSSEIKISPHNSWRIKWQDECECCTTAWQRMSTPDTTWSSCCCWWLHHCHCC